MRVVTGGDWSIGLGMDRDLHSALLNPRLGEGLREIYAEVVEQPLPTEFSRLIEKMRDGVAKRGNASGAGAPKHPDP